jgi:spore coat protein U-like protein
MRTPSKLSLTVLALVAFGAGAAQAQSNNASITATASVQTPINVTGAQQLNFGNVFPGVNKTVAATDLANAGRFDVTGQASTPVTMSFTLPATLSSAGNTLPIGTYTGIRADNSAQTIGVAAFTPGASNAATLSGAGALFVWVGAQVQPATNQAAGTYTGTITLTVVY